MVPEIVEVAHMGDVSRARTAARDLARAIGFNQTASEEIGIAASELGTNLVRHAKGGRLELTVLDEDGRRGLQMESYDAGPGFAEVERALTDGFSTAGSLGYGLGAVHRLMHSCEVTSEAGPGAHIVAKRWLHPADEGAPFPLDIGVAGRVHPGSKVSGDAFVAQRRADMALAGVIDGLGHGPYAHRAAMAARHFVETHYDQPLDELFRGVARACRGTRGVVMALARFDARPAPPPLGSSSVGEPGWHIRLSFAGIGNIEARALLPTEPLRLDVRRGVLGATAPAPRAASHDWDPRGLLVLHSDGLAASWQWEDFAGLAEQSAGRIAHRMLEVLAKDTDDATVMVIRAGAL